MECKRSCLQVLTFTNNIFSCVFEVASFSGDAMVLAVVVLTTENGAVAREARHLGAFGKILDFRPSEIVSGAIWK